MVEPRDRPAALIVPRRGQDVATDAGLRAAFGLGLSEMGAFTTSGDWLLARVAPHQALLFGGAAPFAAADQALRGAADVIDLSDARIGAVIAGADARRRMRTLVPIDLRPPSMAAGRCAQTIMAHMSVLVLQLDETPTYELHCAASYRESFLHALGQTRHPRT